ncbi:MAG: hypothetical protein CL678_15175 [Bdellovibrionaceae bacterium]|nr:hypothetical protein [Pseudobdellovibrionaceae bacterium]|tara:strand:+ start:113 stop:832 length:720 start_codon:yes stop_codon:yes gene_type:complete
MPLTNKWEPYNRYVQQGMVDGAYASGAFTLICAGPPRIFANNALAATIQSENLTYPIGMVQNVAISHNSQFNRVFEIGSERSYFIRGRTTGQISLGRVLYHGPSILRALYSSYIDTQGGVKVNPFPEQLAASAFNPNKHDVKIQPGYENLYVNLASDLFNNPIGLLIKTMDSNEKTIGAVYAEGCYIPSHTLSTDSQGLMVQEQVAIQFERLIPVKTNMVKLIDGVAQKYSQTLTSNPV